MDKYILREYLTSVFYCLLVFIILVLIQDLLANLSKFIQFDVPIHLIAKYYLNILIPFLKYIAPSSLLFATLYCLWQFTRHNELIAMRANGLSLYRILVPFLVVGFCFSAVIVSVDEFLAPNASIWASEFERARYDAEKMKSVIYKNHAFANTAARRQWRVDEFDLKQPHVLTGVVLTRERKDGTRIDKIFTHRAECLDGTWWFHNMTVQKYDANDNPMGKPTAILPGKENVKELPYLNEKPADFVSTAKKWDYLSSVEMIQYLKSHPDLSLAEIEKKQVDLHTRLSLPWACFIVTFFAVPAGAHTGRQSTLTSIFMAIAFLFAFYALMQVGIILGKTGRLAPPLAAWLSNLVFLAVGIDMIRRLR